MNTLYAATILVYANLAAEAPEKLIASAATPLHGQPTIVSMWKQNNHLRGRVGLRGHRLSPVLTRAAQDHANYMARTGVFSHHANGGPSGRARRYGFRGGIRENIAMGQGSVRSAFHSWRNSGGHWANITSGTADAGFGYAVSRNGTPYWVAVYGTGARR